MSKSVKSKNATLKKVKKLERQGKYLKALHVCDEYLDNNIAEESLILLCLNNENYITGVFEVARGNIDHVNIEISNIFKRAFACNSKRIIICHNHPSRFFNS